MPYYLHEYNHYNDGSIVDNGYWEIDFYDIPDNIKDLVGCTCRVYNICGGWHNVTIEANDEIIQADSWDDLDYTYLLNPHSRLGWLSPEGEFYGCKYFEHRMIADRVIHKDERELEREGWVKMYKNQLFPLDPPEYFLGQSHDNIRANYLTNKQVEVLLEKGFEVRPWEAKDWDEKLD